MKGIACGLTAKEVTKVRIALLCALGYFEGLAMCATSKESEIYARERIQELRAALLLVDV